MTDTPYSKREVDNLHISIMEKMQEHNKATMAKLDSIESQTIKTNGRVTELEKRHYIFLGALSVITAVVVPILGWALYTVANIDGQVEKGVQRQLSQYEVIIE